MNWKIIIPIFIIGLVFFSGCTDSETPTGEAIVNSQEANSYQKECNDECSSSKCEDLIYFSCEDRDSDGCNEEVNKGKVLGKCGVECISDSDCTYSYEECKNNLCTEKPVEIGHAKSKPASANTALSTHFEFLSQEVDAEITLLGAKRGEEAWEMIEEANMFNDEPSSGKEYLLTKIRFKLLATSDDKAYDINSFQFESVSGTGKVYEDTWIVEPEPSLSADLYPGAEHEGWITFEIDEHDSNPLIVFERDDEGELWFSIN